MFDVVEVENFHESEVRESFDDRNECANKTIREAGDPIERKSERTNERSSVINSLL